jgi:hypothetical protein
VPKKFAIFPAATSFAGSTWRPASCVGTLGLAAGDETHFMSGVALKMHHPE